MFKIWESLTCWASNFRLFADFSLIWSINELIFFFLVPSTEWSYCLSWRSTLTNKCKYELSAKTKNLSLGQQTQVTLLLRWLCTCWHLLDIWETCPQKSHVLETSSLVINNHYFLCFFIRICFYIYYERHGLCSTANESYGLERR